MEIIKLNDIRDNPSNYAVIKSNIKLGIIYKLRI